MTRALAIATAYDEINLFERCMIEDRHRLKPSPPSPIGYYLEPGRLHSHEFSAL